MLLTSIAGGGRYTAEHPPMDRTALYNNDPAPNVSIAKAEKPWLG